MKRILIAHQSTIPHYRLPFYNTLQKMKPDDWEFDVVYDSDEGEKKRFFSESIDLQRVTFPLHDTNTISIRNGNSRVTFQDFIFRSSKYDLIIVEQALNNLSYPIVQLRMLRGRKVALWGHGRQISAINPSLGKKATEFLKRRLLKASSGFFAYTDGIKNYLEGKGYESEKIFVLNNTIDIIQQREYFDRYVEKRAEIKRKQNLEGKKVLLFVGRFNHTKKLDFLIRSVNVLFSKRDDFRLLLVGDGNKSFFDQLQKQEFVQLLGSITDLEELAPLYCISDLFVFPGQVGLGPLQALCYDLPTMTIASEKHMPEFEYLNEANSKVLPKDANEVDFALAIENFFSGNEHAEMKREIWRSIKHLTLENMALNMIRGINQLVK